MKTPLAMSSATRPPAAASPQAPQVPSAVVLWDSSKEIDFTNKYKLGKELGKGESLCFFFQWSTSDARALVAPLFFFF